jgi:hypothetical protein
MNGDGEQMICGHFDRSLQVEVKEERLVTGRPVRGYCNVQKRCNKDLKQGCGSGIDSAENKFL